MMGAALRARLGADVCDTWLRAWPLAFGVGLLLIPSWLRDAAGIWQIDEYSHAPIVIGMALYLAWRQRTALLQAPGAGSNALGASLLVFGALAYVPSVWIRSGFLEAGSAVVMIAGALALHGGRLLVRRLAVPLLLLLLAAPLPGNVIAAVTGTLKEWVSQSAEYLLYTVGYPIGRSGVTLTIGGYRLLVADACSGMNSLFSLTAVGIFYLSLVVRAQRWQTFLLGLAILPIAVLANILRVLALILITYHLGDAAGQGFLHEFAGLLMFLVALGTLIALEALLRLAHGRQAPVAPPAPDASRHG